MVKEWDSRGIDSLEIASDQLFNISIISGKEEGIELRARIEGELYAETVVNAKLGEKTLFISTDLTPFFTPENDKLAAHKVMSLEFELKIPSRLAIVIRSKLSSVKAKGPFRYFDVELEQGRCELFDFYGSARLYTIKGDITARCREGQAAVATSKYGTVRSQLRSKGKRLIEAESIYGAINLMKTQ